MKTTNHNGWLLMNCIVSLQLELTTNITGDCCNLQLAGFFLKLFLHH